MLNKSKYICIFVCQVQAIWMSLSTLNCLITEINIPQFHQLSSWLVSDDPAGEEGTSGGPGLAWLPYYSFKGFSLFCRIIVKTSKLWHNSHRSCRNQKREIIQSSHPLPWWQLYTLLAFSQPASLSSHLECISINRCALLKVNSWNLFPS